MTWLFEKAGSLVPPPVDVLGEGLFASRLAESIFPLEFGPANPPPEVPVPEEEVSQQTEEEREAHDRAHQVRLMIDAAREEAMAETRSSLEGEYVASVERERARVTRILDLFGEERARWFRRAEAEIVELAQAIARRVLDRELKLDSLCLHEIALAAIRRVEEESGVVLRVAPGSVADWRSAFASRPDLEVMADPQVPEGGCVVDTTFGRVELGIEVQLEEVSERFREIVGGPRRMLVRG